MDEKIKYIHPNDLSIIIPVLNDIQHVKKLIIALLNQTIFPMEIIIIDSSDNKKIEKLLNNKIFSYHNIDKSYPGKSTNYGVKISKGKWLGFLDSKTIPKKNWIENYIKYINKKKYKVVFGVTEFTSTTKFQELIQFASYGNIPHETFPGTIVKKNVYLKLEGLNEFVRAGYDIDWRNKIKRLNINYFLPSKPYIVYSSFPNNLFELLKKYIVYSFHTAKIDIQKNTKDLYLSLFVILTSLIIPKWNHLIGEWGDSNPLFIPHISKIYVISIISLFIGFQISNILINVTRTSIFDQTIKIIIIIFISLSVMQWNDVIANWMEDNIWYIPHITKIYLCSLVLFSILFRGIYFPINRNVQLKKIFPFKWIKIGFLGLMIDIVKTPGYLLGSLYSIFRKK